MADFHSYKPRPVYKGKNMDVFRESTYPGEIVSMMGAPTNYVAYLTEGGREMALGGADTETELVTELQHWKKNKAVYRLIKDDINKYNQAVRQRVRDSVVTVPGRSATTKPTAKIKRAPVRSVKLCYDPNLRQEATTRPEWQECVIIVGGKFFKLPPRGQKWVIAHETGHTFEKQIKNLEHDIIGGYAAPLFGKMVDSGKRLHYEGVFDEYKPSEAFATCVAELYYSPTEFKKRYPEAYDFIKNTLPANWKDAVRANIAQIPNVEKKYRQHKHVPEPSEQMKYLTAHKMVNVAGCRQKTEFTQLEYDEAVRETKRLEKQGKRVQISEVTPIGGRPWYDVIVLVCGSSGAGVTPTQATPGRKPAPPPTTPPILAAPPELAADVLGAGMGLPPTAAPGRKPAARTTRKPPAKPKAVPKARKPKKTAAAKTRKTTKKAAKPKAKKTAATPKLTASQREYLAIQGFVMVKRGGKYVRITG